MHDHDRRDNDTGIVPAISLPVLLAGIVLPFCLVIGGCLALQAFRMALFGIPLEMIWMFACFILVPACLTVCWNMSPPGPDGKQVK
ncbi:hypothetical protein LU298_05005 [Komagataeibacter intermedius]|uniref:Transmembrane protein n=2 Tax=Komagataeibacter intermedius TaxID=66229 RepID=A0A0N1FDQ2_9PROT|nr:hypothetical protein [Komagataeibacter intermedius]KPH88212.1 hypothetical protein GLUCOINTEAF2_0201807 [Komagataeibacter intermedius AF2]MCF3635858.1 hypothetical protein [Komagataeibacter intermedius]GAN86255.1 hypothetical protein Gain_0024_022 [Komagataeibacter intermedius TF2]GBQ76695.1 hypothetical protein AA0521_2942 [Komagataeibacter intermedius NRIC 0521]